MIYQCNKCGIESPKITGPCTCGGNYFRCISPQYTIKPDPDCKGPRVIPSRYTTPDPLRRAREFARFELADDLHRTEPEPVWVQKMDVTYFQLAGAGRVRLHLSNNVSMIVAGEPEEIISRLEG